MPSLLDDLSEGIVRREMVLFFLIDTSGSMEGTKIGSVNTAIREVIPELRGIGGADVSLKIAALTFSTDCKWMHSAPVPVEDFIWNNIGVGGTTELGAACLELNGKMSRNEFLKSPSGSVAPAIILMSDGEPTDNYATGIEKLKGNNWFRHAIKIAVAIQDSDGGADVDVLAEFTGNKEAVLTVYTPEALKQMIRFVSITSAQIGSKSQPVTGGGVQTKQDDMIQQVKNFADNNPAVNVSPDGDDWD